jgi:hypothetical protein
MQHPGMPRAFESHRTDLCHAMMIEYSSAGPCSFDPLACSWNASSRFTGNNDQAKLAPGQIDAFLVSDLSQPQSIRWSAAEDSCLILQDEAKARFAV